MIARNIKKIFSLNKAFSTRVDLDVLKHSFRTQNDPINQSLNDFGQFYTLNPEICNVLFAHGGIPRSFSKQIKTFTEACIMVREPALEVIDYLNRADSSKPVIRYILYGKKGTGKSITLAHILHYAHLNNYLLVHVPWVSEWLRRITRKKEMTNSVTRSGFVDLPMDAAAWLIHFKKQNYKLLKEHDLPIHKEYVWSKREVSPIGSPLLEMVELGINRIKYASDIIVCLAEEIKQLSTKKFCKTLVAVDGFNAFYYHKTNLKTDTKKNFSPKDVTLTLAFQEITKNDWSNGAIVLVADQQAVPTDHQESYFPRYLFGKEGFEHLDPFVPVEVKNFNEKEFLSCCMYYRDRLWLRGHPGIETELAFTSGMNPYDLMELCAPL